MNWSETEQARLWGGVDRPTATLRTLYEDEGYSISHLSSVYDCSTSAIIEDLCDLGLLDAEALFPNTVPRYRTKDKYEVWEHGPHCVRVHRLLMVAEHGFAAVADAVAIHHESFPWDNRPDALVVCKTREQHRDLHADHPGEHEDQCQLSEFDDSQEDSAEKSEEPEQPDADTDPDVEMDHQRTLDEFVRV